MCFGLYVNTIYLASLPWWGEIFFRFSPLIFEDHTCCCECHDDFLCSLECGKLFFEINFYDFRLKFNKFGWECLRVCWIIELFPNFIILTFIASPLLVFWFCLRTRFITFSPCERIFSFSVWLTLGLNHCFYHWMACFSFECWRDSDKRSTFDAQLVYATHLDISVSINWTKTKRRNGNNRHFMLIERFCRFSLSWQWHRKRKRYRRFLLDSLAPSLTQIHIRLNGNVAIFINCHIDIK